MLPAEIDYLLKNKDVAPEMAVIYEHRKAMEKAEVLLRANKDLERKLEYFNADLAELKKDKKISQESFS